MSWMSESAHETIPGRSANKPPCFVFCAVGELIAQFDEARVVTALEPNVALGYAGASPIASQLLRGPEIYP